MDESPLPIADYSSWKLVTKNILEKIFGPDSPNVTKITEVGKLGIFSSNAAEWNEYRRKSLATQVIKLGALIEFLQIDIDLRKHEGLGDEELLGDTSTNHKKIFIVHGRDETTLDNIARFIERLDLDPIILREQPNMGRTIIEKFSDYSDVGFAVVILTPDDLGKLSTDFDEKLVKRARQNVILELGFMLGKLGRKRVCALYISGVEIPSDYAGVAFISLDDSGVWKLPLAKELVAAGINVDMNKAL